MPTDDACRSPLGFHFQDIVANACGRSRLHADEPPNATLVAGGAERAGTAAGTLAPY
jgi:hypothetical protein